MSAKAAITIAMLCIMVQTARAKSVVQTIDVPGAAFTSLVGINDSGVIAGNAYISGNHGVLRATNGDFTVFDPPNSFDTVALAIDAGGDIVGYFQAEQGVAQCFIRSAAGEFTVFGQTKGSKLSCGAAAINGRGDVAGYTTKNRHDAAFLRKASGRTSIFLKQDGAVISASGINNASTVVGTAPGGAYRAGFLRTKDGTITTFDAPGDTDGTFVRGINDQGTIAGTFADGGGNDHGFVRAADGTITVVDVSGAIETEIAAINAKGDTTGTYSVTGKSRGGFLRLENGDISIFAPEGFASTFPASLNARGVIVGSYTDPQGNQHGFIRTP
jgi:hypothetical protein